MKKRISAAIVVMIIMALSAACSNGKKADNTKVSNKMFSITLPDKAAGKFVSETTDNSISIFDKEAKEADFGGFAFSVSAYKEPSEYAGGMDSKVGEFTADDGTLYDVVVSYPSDVQYDYTKYDDLPESYEMLYRGAEDIIKTLEGADGKGEFAWGGGKTLRSY